MANHLPGTAGYREQAEALFKRYEEIPFDHAHAPVLSFVPKNPSRILDIGAGTGRDAAHLAAQGHEVVAVEPTDALRSRAIEKHHAARIEWIDDGLPELSALAGHEGTFDVIMLTAVWMHLDQAERRRGMGRLSALVKDDGHVIMSLRHGPVPEGRRMFQVTAEETVSLAEGQGLKMLLNQKAQSIREPNKRLGVTWTRLVFRKRG